MKLICERAACAIGLDICGVDLVVPDISEPFRTGGVVEVNAAPGLRMHHWPSEGTPRDVGGEIIKMLYPSGDGRIPIVAITGTNGKTTVTRLIAHILAKPGVTVGMTTTDGIWIGDAQVASGDTTGPRSATTVLSDPGVDIAVLETAAWRDRSQRTRLRLVGRRRDYECPGRPYRARWHRRRARHSAH